MTDSTSDCRRCGCGAQGASDPQEGLVAWFTACHRRCDQRWAEVEVKADLGDAEGLQRKVSAFCEATRAHFDVEDTLLFPMAEEAMQRSGFVPTQAMRAEHQQMRALLRGLEDSASQGDFQGVLDLGDTLLMFTQQHNAKEEQVLYPLAEHVLGDKWPALLRRLTGEGC